MGGVEKLVTVGNTDANSDYGKMARHLLAAHHELYEAIGTVAGSHAVGRLKHLARGLRLEAEGLGIDITNPRYRGSEK